MRLFSLQLLVALAMMALMRFKKSRTSALSVPLWRTATSTTEEIPIFSNYLALICFVFLTALSWPLFYQAILHLLSLPTLLMLSVSSIILDLIVEP